MRSFIPSCCGFAKNISPNQSGPGQIIPVSLLSLHSNLPKDTAIKTTRVKNLCLIKIKHCADYVATDLRAFTGWWLSMDSGDSFLEKLQPLDDIPKLLDRRRRFNRTHKDTSKTLGFLLVKR